jgi:peptide-methionine (R)-S-oxide reductase
VRKGGTGRRKAAHLALPPRIVKQFVDHFRNRVHWLRLALYEVFHRKGQGVRDKPELSDAEWREKLTPEQYHILREAGTERAFTGKYDKHYDAGEYYCAGCGQKLFGSEDKYNSGCGWPAFTEPAEGEVVEEHRDVSHGMVRTEVTCSNCGGHLGHVFPDGPRDRGGLRYCINSAALDFEPEG